jgi:D-alanyl-D-alanine carboxypeptidase/D-alanyl-D-alanine-endopeptidase (penicillin-binding protein 4)
MNSTSGRTPRAPTFRILLFFLLFTAAACAKKIPEAPQLPPVPAPPPPSPLELLQKDLAGIFAESTFDNAFWGVLVESLETDEILYQQNAEKLLIPASNMKLVTAAAALHYLHPDFRFETVIATDGPIHDGVLKGNLFIIGTGDPSISNRFYPDSTWVFRDWAEKLKETGIHEIAGDVIGVDDFFDDQRWGPGWAWDDLPYKDAAPVSALQFNDNLYTIVLDPDRVKSLDPENSYIHVVNDLQWTAEGQPQEVLWKVRGNTVYVWGRIPAGKDDYGTFAVENPAEFFVSVFKHVLQRSGMTVRGDAFRAGDRHLAMPENLQLLLSHQSPPLSELLDVMLKVSQNLYAETLFKAVGRMAKGKGSFEGGTEAVQEFFTTIAAPADSFLLADGSGLSRYNYLTPQLLLHLLKQMSHEPDFSIFYDSLPLAGVEGTLRNRLKNTAGESNVRAKTGALLYVRSLSGYVTTQDGEPLAFVMIANNFSAPRQAAEEIQDRVLQRLATFSRSR